MKNENRLFFDNLCRDCEDAGLDRPHMNPWHLGDKWEVHIGSVCFTGSAGGCLEKAHYWVRGYQALQVLQKNLENEIREQVDQVGYEIPAPLEPVELGVFTCNRHGGLRVDVQTISGVTARMVIGCQDNTELYVNKNSAGILAKFFTRLESQLEK